MIDGLWSALNRADSEERPTIDDIFTLSFVTLGTAGQSLVDPAAEGCRICIVD